jgi:hypothetical protein
MEGSVKRGLVVAVLLFCCQGLAAQSVYALHKADFDEFLRFADAYRAAATRVVPCPEDVDLYSYFIYYSSKLDEVTFPFLATYKWTYERFVNFLTTVFMGSYTFEVDPGFLADKAASVDAALRANLGLVSSYWPKIARYFPESAEDFRDTMTRLEEADPEMAEYQQDFLAGLYDYEITDNPYRNGRNYFIITIHHGARVEGIIGIDWAEGQEFEYGTDYRMLYEPVFETSFSGDYLGFSVLVGAEFPGRETLYTFSLTYADSRFKGTVTMKSRTSGATDVHSVSIWKNEW